MIDDDECWFDADSGDDDVYDADADEDDGLMITEIMTTDYDNAMSVASCISGCSTRR